MDSGQLSNREKGDLTARSAAKSARGQLREIHSTRPLNIPEPTVFEQEVEPVEENLWAIASEVDAMDYGSRRNGIDPESDHGQMAHRAAVGD